MGVQEPLPMVFVALSGVLLHHISITDHVPRPEKEVLILWEAKSPHNKPGHLVWLSLWVQNIAFEKISDVLSIKETQLGYYGKLDISKSIDFNVLIYVKPCIDVKLRLAEEFETYFASLFSFIGNKTVDTWPPLSWLLVCLLLPEIPSHCL